MATDDALISRRVMGEVNGMVIINEVWDTTHPDCPFTYVNPLELIGVGVPYVKRQIEMPRAEFQARKPKLKEY